VFLTPCIILQSIHQPRLRGPPSLLYNGYRVFPGGKGGRGMMLTTHPLLEPRLRQSWAILPLTLRVLLGLLRGSLYSQYINQRMHLVKYNSWQVSNSYIIRHRVAIYRELFRTKRYTSNTLVLYSCIILFQKYLRMELRCQNMSEFNIYHDLYFIKCIFWLRITYCVFDINFKLLSILQSTGFWVLCVIWKWSGRGFINHELRFKSPTSKRQISERLCTFDQA
jgi:hypothetical protein